MRSTILLVLALMGCGSESSDTPASSADAGGDSAPTTDTASATDAASDAGDIDLDLVGEWESLCVPVGGDYWGITRLTITSTRIDAAYDQYKSDNTCKDSSKKVLSSYGFDSKWTVGGKLGELRPIDRVVGSSEVLITEEAARQVWDRDSGCGPFTLGVAKDVTGLTCYGVKRPKPGDTVYDVYEHAMGMLAFGDRKSGDMQTPATRPTSLDRMYVYSRKK